MNRSAMPHIVIRLSVVWSFFLQMHAVLGQTGRISGQILDSQSQPVSFAQVQLLPAKTATQTDSLGRFAFQKIPFGSYKIIAKALGFSIQPISISLHSDAIQVSLLAQPVQKDLAAVEVLADQSESSSNRALKSIENFGLYEGKKSEVVVLKTLVGNQATNNPRQVFARISGITIWESDGAGLQLGIGGRGLSPNRTSNFNVRQNGYDISADALGYPESYYTPPVEALDRIEVVRGAGALQYGTQFGGLLNFQFKKGPSDKKLEFTSRQTAGSWGFFNSFNSIGGTLAGKRLNYYGYLQFKRGDGYRVNSGFNYGNGYFQAEYALNDQWTIGMDYTKMYYLARQPGGLTDRNFQENPKSSFRSRNWFEVDWNLASFTTTYRRNTQTQFQLKAFGLQAIRNSLGNLERINVIDFGGPRTLISGQFQNIGAEGRFLHRYSFLSRQHAFLLGTRIYRGVSKTAQGLGPAGQAARFSFLNPSQIENSDYTFPNTNLALFSENIVAISPRFSLVPGFRLEHIKTQSKGYYNILSYDAAGNEIARKRVVDNQSRERSFALVGLGLNFQADSNIKIYANITQNYRAINFNDLRIVNPNFKVDSNIRDEKGYTADLGIRGKVWSRISFELTGFLLMYKGKIGQVLRADQPPLFIDYRFRGNISDARSLGLESLIEAEIWRKKDQENKALSAFANFSVVDARYINTQDASIKNKKVEMVPPFLLRTGAVFSFRSFGASLQYSWVGRHFSDATNAIRTATAVEGQIPSYQVVDFSVRYGYKRWLLEGSLNNLFNEAYFTRRAESYPGPGILPSDGRSFFITLGYRY